MNDVETAVTNRDRSPATVVPNLDLRTAQTERERELIRQALNWKSLAEESRRKLDSVRILMESAIRVAR